MQGGPAALAGFAAVLLLGALRVPIGIAMALVGAAGALLLGGWSQASYILANLPFEAVATPGMEIVPLFIFMGVFASVSGLSHNLYAAVSAALGHFRGGIAMATVGASAAFGAICGSSLATAATIGRAAMPEMRARGYADSLSAASIAAGGTLGVLIPPSILIVLYAILTGQSIGALFAAALVPGLIATLLYMGAIALQVRLKPDLAPPSPPIGRRERLAAFARIWDAALLIFVVIGGLYGRVFSPTEAASVGAAGALLITAARGRLTRKALVSGIAETAGMTGMVFLILIGASLFNYFIELTRVTGEITAMIEASSLPPLAVIFLIVVFYVALGCFMDSLSMVLLTVVPAYQLVTGLGYDPVWFGVLVVMVAEIGLITPPIGMNLFVIQGVTPGLRLGTIIAGILPFIGVDLMRIALVALFPALALALPRLLGLM
ncbi:TRAP transporter large permease [Afifella sp. IM 167]|uniref:TRAP transporter large permease n=1 Tax=Afifella sp. IM 167 TaxID=2033586 RepID=UPI001CCF9C02|nr:TRAP transporter large permease [Afifella sp. IM 167]MBZ8132054.1 C4-dicarboxylate ABC transporter permease [Afifella sp. IM 167]